MTSPAPHACEGCREPGKYSILLASGPARDEAAPERVYLPNYHTRAHGDAREHWFCATCMRALEDSFRATLLYLQAESGRVTPIRFEAGR